MIISKEELEIMAAFSLDLFEAALAAATINGQVDPAALKAQVTADVAEAEAANTTIITGLQNTVSTLQNSLTADEGVEASLVTRTTALESLTVALGTGLNDILAKIQAGDTAGAAAAAQAALATVAAAAPVVAGTETGTAA